MIADQPDILFTRVGNRGVPLFSLCLGIEGDIFFLILLLSAQHIQQY